MSSQDFNPMALGSRRILVTGASSGIGRATAVLLSRLGASVICVDYDTSGLEQTLSLLEGKDHLLETFDLSNLDDIPKWLEVVVQKAGRLHGLVHAAGLQVTSPIRLLSPEKWRMLLKVNTEAAFSLSRSFQERNIYAGENGSIVFISSVMGQVGAPGLTAYSLSKGALDGLARSLALELAPRHIRVNCVAPAFVNTPMFQKMQRMWTEDQRARVEAQHPLGIGTPEDVALAIAFLLADSAKWITGTVLIVDGGYTAQ
jgi:NAD(P)-dependent dehydrogenase (short-subunit alcohol dehydrogenase family)